MKLFKFKASIKIEAKSKNSHTTPPVALVILDGVGQPPASKGNAVKLTNTPSSDKWSKEFPNILMQASGTMVGLPAGQMGNSEVGHTNIGAGRIVYQSLALINKEIETGNFTKNKIINDTIKHSQDKKVKFHILGLLSDGGVHSNIDHIIELANYAKTKNIEVFVHAFTDGRDVGRKTAISFIRKLKKHNINIASLSGRFYAMDRDKRWERVQKAYDVLVQGLGNSFKNEEEYIESQYKEGIFDEFIIPAFNTNLNGTINDNDSVIFINFRPDRPRELSHLLIGSNVKVTNYDYNPSLRRNNLFFVTMREYAGIEKALVIYPFEVHKNLLGEVLEKHGLRQMRAAETEKYPHVTFFIDGGKEIPKKHEIRILVDSPKVETYDLEPEMSARPLTEKIIKNADDIDVFLINYAQPDMVGHTGHIPAVIKAMEVADEMLGKLYKKIVEEMGGTMIITADHGNADIMLDKNNEPMTTHTTNPVQVIITDKNIKFKDKFKQDVVAAKLGDLAPTILKMKGIKKPFEMTGESLIK